jgi:tetratricopeptide (TPR) repeat protein
MRIAVRFVLRRLTRLLAAAVLAPALACAQLVAPDAADDEGATRPPSATLARTFEQRLPSHDLTEDVLYEFLLGEVALQRGSPGLAAQTYLELARQTRDPRIARRAVEIANYARIPDLALEAARIWHEADAQSPQALQMLTALLVSVRRVDEAEPYLSKLLSAPGSNLPNGFMQLGRMLAGNPDKSANLRVVRRLAEPHPSLPQARFALAQAALAADDDELALNEIRRASALQPDWEIAAIFEAQILQRKSPEQAERTLAAYLGKFPDRREVRLSYARLLVTNKRYAPARSEFETLLAANPGDTDVIYAVGLLAYQLKDYAIAEGNFKRLLQLGYRDENGVRFTLGQIAEDQKQWARAIEWFESIGRGDHFVPSRLRAAQSLAKQGKLAEARAYLRRVDASAGEQQVQLVIAEAQLLRDANEPGEALVMLGEALARQPDQPELLYDLALTAEKLNRFDLLESNLRKLIQIRPEHAHAYNALGYSLADRSERLSEARKLIERALELAPQDHFIIDSMGWVLYRQGELKGAIEHLRRAYVARPDAEIGAHLGEVLWMSGARDEAERVFNEALQAYPDNETLQKTIKRLKQ